MAVNNAPTTNWWINSYGENRLKGVKDDPTNPIRIQDKDILYYLQQYPDSYDDYFLLIPYMLPEEQVRLRNLITDNPYVTVPLVDPSVQNDRIQRAWMRRGIYTAGPRGGGN